MSDATVSVLRLLDDLVRQVAMAGADDPQAGATAALLSSAIDHAIPPFSLRFIALSLFRDHRLVTLDGDDYERALRLGDVLARRGATAIAFHCRVPTEDLVALACAIVRPSGKPPGALSALRLASLRAIATADELPGALCDDRIDVFTSAELELALGALAETEALARAGRGVWQFGAATSAVRWLLRAERRSPAWVEALLEAGPWPLDMARRALLVANHVLVVGRAAGMTQGFLVALLHAACAVALCGLGPRAGELYGAALVGARRLLDASARVVEPTPQIVEVCAILADASRADSLGVAGLLQAAYDLERSRLPAGRDDALTIVDILSQAVRTIEESPRTDSSTHWLRLRVVVAGPMPTGAFVRLADGREGVSLGPSVRGGVLRPTIMVDGQRYEPSSTPILLGSADAVPPSGEPKSAVVGRVKLLGRTAPAGDERPTSKRRTRSGELGSVTPIGVARKRIIPQRDEE